MPRSAPNIIITGTPGVGKTSHSELLAQNIPSLTHLSINTLVKERGCHEGWDEAAQSWIVDEDALLDTLEEDQLSEKGGYIIDWHACDLFPKAWIDLVVVLRTATEALYDRLKARNYNEGKLQENIDAEVMEVILDEARESYDEEIVVELKSEGVEDLEANVERIERWVEAWKKDHGRVEDG